MWGSGWGGVGAVFVIICIGLMVWMMLGHGMMGHGGRRHGEGTSGEAKGSSPDAGQILAERFARGEISEEEFEQRKRVLEREPS